MEATPAAADLLVRAVAFVDGGVCPLIGLCLVLYPLAGAAWRSSRTYERTSLYAGGLAMAIYTVASLAIAPETNAVQALGLAVRAILAAVATGLLAAIVAALIHILVVSPARRIAGALERARAARVTQRKRGEDEAQRRRQEAEAQQRNAQRYQFDEQARRAREAEESRRQAAASARNAARYEFHLRYVAARPHLSERLSEAEFEALLQTTLEPTDSAELESRKAALAQLLDSFSQEALAKQPPASVEQIVTEFQRRHAEIDAASFATDVKEKMHRWLNKEESQAISRFMMARYD